MAIAEIFLLILIFTLSVALLIVNFDVAITLLLFLSVLLHKEFFSIYRWDVLPVRVFMLAAFFTMVFKFVKWWLSHRDFKKLIEYAKEPFILFFTLIWLVNGVSLIFTANFTESILLYGFFTTVYVLSIALYLRLKGNKERVFKLIRTYIYILFGLVIFGFVQMLVYMKTGFIFGALWNIPDRLPRIGATFWDVNHFAGLLAALLPVLGVFILVSKKWKHRLIYSMMFLPMGVMLLLTNSRSAWILAFVAFIVFIVLQLVRRFGFKAIYGILLALLIVSGGLFWEYSKKESPFRAYVKDYMHYRIDSFDAHFMLIEGAYQVLEEYPYLGGGYGSFFEHFSNTEIAPIYFGRDPISITSGLRTPGHSIWGELAAETGWIGIIVYLPFVLYVFLGLIKTAITLKDNKESLLVSGMVASLIGWYTAGIFYSYKAEFFWLVFVLYFLYGISLAKENFEIKAIVEFFGKSRRTPIFVFIFLGFILIFLGLGENAFIPWDEAIYAKIAKNMVTTGDYLRMQWDLGKIWYEKPPLAMWMMAAMMNIFGITEFAARLPSAIFGFGTVILTYVFGKRLFNKTTGYFAGLSIITTTYILYHSRLAMTDISTTFFITLALYFYWKTVEDRKPLKNWLIAGAAIGAAAMIKNVVGFLPLVIIGFNEIYLLVTKQTKFMFGRYALLALVSFAIYLPWHIVMYSLYGQSFIDQYYIYHVLQRGTSEIEDKGKPFFWYLVVLKVGMRVWFVALLGAFPLTFVLATLKKHKKHAFLLIYSLVIFLFFSASASKLVWYIMPIYPVLAIMVGFFLERTLNFAMKKVKSLDTPVFKVLSIYGITLFALFYLFLNRDLVYVSDLTGAEATLLELKEELYGTEIPVYVDKVAPPVAKFYLDGEYVEVEFSRLENTIKRADYDQQIIYITKASRQERINRNAPEALLIQREGDHVLGFYDSQFSRDSMELNAVIKEKAGVLNAMQELVEDGKFVPEDYYTRLFNLEAREAELIQTIEAGLAEE